MKKLIGIILAVCMLFTVAAAANTITQNGDPALDTTNRTVTVKFTGIPGTEQATLFAYEVTDAMITKATPIPAFVSNEATPIKGIDQATVSTITTTEGETTVSSFTFKVAADYVGKMVVKVGGTDADPISMLVEFKAAGGNEGGNEGGEVNTVIFIVGDVDGDEEVTTDDADALLTYASQRKDARKEQVNVNFGTNIGAVYVSADGLDEYVVGDVDGDGEVTTDDADALVTYASQRKDARKEQVNINFGTNIGEEFEVVDETSSN